jgi:hypothetical protein
MSKYQTKWLCLKKDGGYPFGVAADHAGDSNVTELHGPFESYEVAKNYGAHLRAEFSDYGDIRVVKIEIPGASDPRPPFGSDPSGFTRV